MSPPKGTGIHKRSGSPLKSPQGHDRKVKKSLKGLTMIFAGLENPFIIFRSKEKYICFKTNNKIPINLVK